MGVPQISPALMNREEAARYLAISERTLRRLPIRTVKIGASVRYLVSDLDIYISLHTRRSA
jgi:hypothetical protein